jgi:signal transduction histidine kinase
MLLLARLERDPLAVCEVGPISLSFLLAGADLTYRPKARAEGIALRMIPPAEDARFEGDARRLSQVLGNLLDNAIRFTPDGGRIDLIGLRESDFIRILVADTGPGVPEAELERVFDRFHQAEQGDARPEGLGLGLAICRHIVQAHGGTITARNRDAGGAEFSVEIPVDARVTGLEDPCNPAPDGRS